MHVCEARQTAHFLFFSVASLKHQILPSNTKADVQVHCSYIYIMRTAVLTSVIYLCIFLFIPVWVLQVDSGCSFQEGLGCCSPVADPVSGGFKHGFSLFALEQWTRFSSTVCSQLWNDGPGYALVLSPGVGFFCFQTLCFEPVRYGL